MIGQRQARSTASAAHNSAHLLHLGMVAWPVAGIQTHYDNVRPIAEATPDIAVTPIVLQPWRHGGRIERLSFLPERVRGTLRTYTNTAPLYTARPLSAVWTQSLVPLTPFLLTRGRARRIPVVYDADSTPRLLASFGPQYAEQVQGTSLKRRTIDALQTMAARRCAAIVCWSEWAARSFEVDYQVPRERLTILPPGVHIAAWARPDDVLPASSAAPRPRLLFVGGDFQRKGGDLLLDVWRRHFAERCELHLVTREPVAAEPGVFVYSRFQPNDPALRRLYHSCDALVLPTRGDCFSLASIEAMAAGLPVITTRVGGIPEIVEDGVTGHLLAPNDGAALRAAIAALLDAPGQRAAMGAAGRARAVSHFDASENAQRLLALVRHVAHAQ